MTALDVDFLADTLIMSCNGQHLTVEHIRTWACIYRLSSVKEDVKMDNSWSEEGQDQRDENKDICASYTELLVIHLHCDT